MSLPAHASTATPSVARSRLADFVELCKLRITLMVMVTSLVGFLMGGSGSPDVTLLLATVLGTGLACAGANSLNQWLERGTDALMKRTRERPLPAHRLGAREALLFGLGMAISGVVLLGLLANTLTALLAAVSVGSYTLVYTPLKRRSGLALYVGAVPGAIPPALGFTGATGHLGLGAVLLFSILFFWQIPHFAAIDWLCREDFRRAGFPTAAVRDPKGGITGRHALGYGLVLLPVSLAPGFLGLAGTLYVWGAALLSLAYAGGGLLLLLRRTDLAARKLLLASVCYLPLLLCLMAIDKRP